MLPSPSWGQLGWAKHSSTMQLAQDRSPTMQLNQGWAMPLPSQAWLRAGHDLFSHAARLGRGHVPSLFGARLGLDQAPFHRAAGVGLGCLLLLSMWPGGALPHTTWMLDLQDHQIRHVDILDIAHLALQDKRLGSTAIGCRLCIL